MIWGGVVKSGSPTPSEMTSGIVAMTSKNFRMPDGGTVQDAPRETLADGCRDGIGGLGGHGTPSGRGRREYTRPTGVAALQPRRGPGLTDALATCHTSCHG